MFGRIKQALWGALFGTLIATQAIGQTATLLPNAKQQFFTAQGIPAAAGTVDMYVPSTTTRKTTWKSSTESVGNQNTNPVLLDAGGFATIYGDGAYRQVVKDADGNTIWDAVTASTGGGGSTPVVPTVGDGNIVGTILPWAGLVAPPNYVFAYGQAISRTTYPLYASTVTIVSTMICTSGLNVLSGLGDTQNIRIGSPVEASCIPPGTTVTAVASTSVTISSTAAISTAVTGTFFPYGNGNGSSTLNVPDLRGLTLVGRQNMGGTGRTGPTPLPPFYWNGPSGTNANSLGALGGSSNQALGTANLPPYLPLGTITNGAISNVVSGGTLGATSTSTAVSAAGVQLLTGSTAIVVTSSQATSTFAGVQQGGTSVPFATVQPSITMNYVVKVLPDASTAVASGVASIGGMTGVIACGTGVICGSNTISLTGSPIPAAFVTFQQTGTGSVILTEDDLLRTRYYTPEMFGAACGIGGDGVANATAINNALAQIAITKGELTLGNCAYHVIGPLNITTGGTAIAGQGATTGGNSEIYWEPTAAAQCAINIGGSGITSGVILRDFAIRSPDTTTYKNAICGTDLSKPKLQGIEIWNWNGGFSAAVTGAVSSGAANEIRLTVAGASVNFSDGWAVAVAGVGGTVEANSAWQITVVSGTQIDLKGSTFTNAFTSNGTITLVSTGLKTMGRELFEVNNVNIAADLPQMIAVNPHFATNSLDQSAFTNITLASTGIGGIPLTLAATTCNVLIADGVVMTNVNWLGMQSWGGGKTGVCWRDKSAPAINEQISWDNVRAEQKAVAGGWFFDLQPSTTTYSVHVNNLTGSDRNGIRARNIANLQLDNPHFIGGAGQTCLDLDSTVQSTQVNGAESIAGTANTLAGQTLWYASPNQTGGCLAPFAHYENSASGSNELGTTHIANDLTLGAVGTLGTATFGNATSGTITIEPVAGVLGGARIMRIPAADDVFVGRATTDTLFNKTISGASNTLTNIGNASLTNSATTVNGQTCTLGASCTVTAAAASIAVGTTTVTGGTTTRVLYDNAGILGEYTTAQLTAQINAATASLSGALPAWPNNTTTFFRGDGTYAAVAASSITWSGTSGGIPYFNSTSTIASSALLGANQLIVGGGAGAAPATIGTLGTTTTLLHGNAAGAPTFGAVVSADMNITTTSCTNQFVTAISSGGVGTCTTDTLAGAQHANQGTTTTVLHGNAGGNPSWAAVSLTADVTGTLPAGNGGTGITALGTGVATALGINVGSAGAFVTFNGALGTPSSGVGTNITGVNAATLGGATFAAPGAIGGGTPSTGAFTTLTASSMGTFGTNAVSGDIIANGPNSGTGAGSQFVTQLAGVANIGMGNCSRLITGGAFDATPCIYGGSGIGVYIGGTTKSISLNAVTVSSSKTTGTVVITGGIGISGTATTDVLNFVTGIQANGTAGITKTCTIATTTTLTFTLGILTATTGAGCV